MFRMERRSRQVADMTAAQCRSAASIQSLLPKYYKPVSLALYQVLEDSGASNEVRNLWKETFTTIEIIGTIAFQPELSIYNFGSSMEGTTLLDMYPDRDVVWVDNRFPVMTDCSDVPREKCLLLVHDDDTQAGYAKLQLVYNRLPIFQNNYGILNAIRFNTRPDMKSYADKYGRIVISFSPKDGSERHGPAIFRDIGIVTFDTVYAFNLSKLPGYIEEWVYRTRNHNWPSADIIDRCKRLGCLFVPVGHPQSDEPNLEWRLSLSHQERLLVSQFNSVQYKCYILLKLWKKDILPSWIGQESLSSYHCKTCMFYMIENTPSDFWRPDNLLCCFIACLRLFLLWTTNGICPNYFIPAENMFDRRIHGEVKRELQQSLQLFLTTDCKYLMQIRTSHIGDRLVSYVTMPLSNRQFYSDSLLHKVRTDTKAMLVFSIVSTYHIRHDCMQKCFSNRSQRCLNNIYNLIQHLIHTNTITEHTMEETKRAISFFVPYLELHLMTGIIALAEQQGRSREEIWRFLFSESWHQLSLRSDISVKLKQASLLYMFEYYNASLDILSSIELRGVYTRCFCYLNIELMAAPTKEEMINAGALRPNITVEHLGNHLFVQCIVFLPTEGNVTPDAIRYEMLRFVDDAPRHTDGLRKDYLRECAVVDGLFLFHFLLYLNHSKLNLRSNVSADISNMNYTINARGNRGLAKCSHREACLNILGWVYKDQGRIETAMECFRRSLEMKPRGNAAVWHIRDIQNMTH